VKKSGNKKKHKIATLDFETDPFLFGRVPEPFCCELWDGEKAIVFWGDDCADQLIEYLQSLDEPLLIYAHNGGKFDFHFLHKAIENPSLIIKTRIVSTHIGIHELRDSFAILPVPLKSYAKEDIDYGKMERPRRETHKAEILEYLHSDCVHLFDLVTAFIERFGPQMTIGGTAMKQMQEWHPHEKCGSRHDERYRPYYYGGRVQCFKSGDLPGPWKYVDRNSMYPAEMADKQHPTGRDYHFTRSMPDDFSMPFFITFEGTNNNALPCVDEEGGLIFTKAHGIFSVCSHELEVALKYDLCRIDNVLECHVATETINFGDFVRHFAAEKAASKAAGDKANEMFAKLIMNSGYGREGINPDNFADWHIERDPVNALELEMEGYQLEAEYPEIQLWSKPADIQEHQYADVAIAASITSAARGNLLENLQRAIDPIYCDTDSIICRDFSGDMHPSRLGAWDLEAEADAIAIAGKKMYCLYDGGINSPVIPRKLSSKGGTLSAAEIIRICSGEIVKYENYAPTFSLKRPPTFVTRNFKITA